MTPLSVLRTCSRHAGHRRRRRAEQCSRPRRSCREMGLSAHLGGGASQHGGHRQHAAVGRLLAHLAAGTTTIRVGAGGIMLPNHAPYVIAEQFGTLARLFPGRIDLGLGGARRSLISSCTPCVVYRRPRNLSARRSRAAGVPAWLPRPTSRPCRQRERRCRSLDYSDQAISARCWRPNWGCPTRSHRISRPNCWCLRFSYRRGLSHPCATRPALCNGRRQHCRRRERR